MMRAVVGKAVRHSAREAVLRIPVEQRRAAWFYAVHHHWPSLRFPRTFSEKINWRILRDRRDSIAVTCDKLAVKDLGSAAGVPSPRTVWVGTDVAELAEVDLPPRWILKPNHSSGAFRRGSGRPDLDELAITTRRWSDSRARDIRGEWGYELARPLLVLEELLGDGALPPRDLRYFVFDGTVRLVQIEDVRDGKHVRRMYTPEWEPLEVRKVYRLANVVPPPPRLEEMLDAARRLAAGYDFMRVDLYDADDSLLLGELSPYDASGLARIEPVAFNVEMGAWWNLPQWP